MFSLELGGLAQKALARSLTANSVDLTRDLGSILRPSQDKILLGIRRSRKRLGLNRLVGNFDGNHPFSCTNDLRELVPSPRDVLDLVLNTRSSM